MGPRTAFEAVPFSRLPTMMPFLYQTRTLSGFNWARADSSCGKHYGNISAQRAFSSYHARYSIYPGGIPMTTKPKPHDSNETRYHITRTSGIDVSIPGNGEKWTSRGIKKSVASYGLKEGMATRRESGQHPQGSRSKTPYKKRVGEKHYSRYDRSVTTSHRRDSIASDTVDLEFGAQSMTEDIEDYIEEDLLDPSEIADLASKRGFKESTITPTERQAFQRIFSEIFSRNQMSGMSMTPQSGHEDREQKGGMKTGNQNFKGILDNVLNNPMGRRPISNEEMENIVSQYPAALRAAAARAIGLTNAEMETEAAASEEGEVLNTDELEALREPERARVEALMKNARTDFELWDILEKEVFSLISKLGLEDVIKPFNKPVSVTKQEKDGKKSKKGRKRRSTLIEAEPVAEELVQAEQIAALTVDSPKSSVSPLALYGPLYPSYLLLALRLLDRSFTNHSPLSLSLLPKIKSLGLISHVLGATTPLYNELLRIHQQRQDDYRSVLKLLSEMDHAGLEMDKETLAIVEDIMRAQIRALKGEEGPSSKALWRLPEFAPGKFRAWRATISANVGRRSLGRAD